MKIYSKKSFWLGIFFSTVSLIYIVLLSIQFNDISNGKFIEYSIYLSLSMLFAFTFIRENLSYQRSKDAKQENDEREDFINLKSSNASINIVQVVSWILMVGSIILWYISKIDSLIGMIIAFGIIFNLSIFSKLLTYIYYNRKI